MRRTRLIIRRVYRDLGTTLLNAKMGPDLSAISNFELWENERARWTLLGALTSDFATLRRVETLNR